MEPTDIDLMLMARNDNADAFRLLAERYRDPLRRYFASLLDDRSLADDFAQETLLRLWLYRHRYEPSGSFSTFVFQIGKHFWLNQRKKQVRRPDPLALRESDGETILAPACWQPDTLVLRRWRVQRVLRAVAGLPPLYRIPLELAHVKGHPYAKIAEQLGIPIGTVKSRISEAVRRLRRMLDDEETGD